MLREPMLDRYPLLRTRDVDELRSWMGSNFAVRKISLPTRPDDFDCTINHVGLSAISLTFARYGAPLEARMSNNAFFLQGFPLSGNGLVHWNEHVVAVDPDAGGVSGELRRDAADPARDRTQPFPVSGAHGLVRPRRFVGGDGAGLRLGINASVQRSAAAR